MFDYGCFCFAHSMRKGLNKANFKNKQKIQKKCIFYMTTSTYIPQPLVKIIIGYLPKIQLQQSRLSKKHMWKHHSGLLLDSFHWRSGQTYPSRLPRFQSLLKQSRNFSVIDKVLDKL